VINKHSKGREVNLRNKKVQNSTQIIRSGARAVSHSQLAVVDENTRMFSSFSPNSILKIGFCQSHQYLATSFEKRFLCLCLFSDFKNSEHLRKRNLGSTTVGNTEFHAEHEYQNRSFQFAEMENIWIGEI
jgi:hypothetical protein